MLVSKMLLITHPPALSTYPVTPPGLQGPMSPHLLTFPHGWEDTCMLCTDMKLKYFKWKE